MRFQLSLISVVVPKGEEKVILGFDMGQPGCYGEIVATPEQAAQLGNDLLGAAVAASRQIDRPVLVTPDLLTVSITPSASAVVDVAEGRRGRHYAMDLETLRYDSRR